MTPRSMLRWVLASTAGESLGMVASAVLGAILPVVLGPAPSPLTSHGMAILGGLLEGGCLGALQASALRNNGWVTSPRRWVWVTALGGGLGWGVATQAGAAWIAPDPTHLAAVGLLLGACYGATMGIVQGTLLPRWAGKMRYLLASMLAWSAGMVVTGMGNAAMPAGDWTIGHFLLLALTGAATGATVGALLLAGFGPNAGNAGNAAVPMGS